MIAEFERTGDIHVIEEVAQSDVERHFVRFATAFDTLAERRAYLKDIWRGASGSALPEIEAFIGRASEHGLSSAAVAALRLHHDLLAIHFVTWAPEIWAEFEPPPEDVLDSVLAVEASASDDPGADTAGRAELLARPEVRNAAHYLRALWHDDPERYGRLRRRLEPFWSPSAIIVRCKRYSAGKAIASASGDPEYAPQARAALGEAMQMEIRIDPRQFMTSMLKLGAPVEAIERYLSTLEIEDAAWLQDERPSY